MTEHEQQWMSRENGYIFWIAIQITIQIAIQNMIQIIFALCKQGNCFVDGWNE